MCNADSDFKSLNMEPKRVLSNFRKLKLNVQPFLICKMAKYYPCIGMQWLNIVVQYIPGLSPLLFISPLQPAGSPPSPRSTPSSPPARMLLMKFGKDPNCVSGTITCILGGWRTNLATNDSNLQNLTNTKGLWIIMQRYKEWIWPDCPIYMLFKSSQWMLCCGTMQISMVRKISLQMVGQFVQT